jgi:hypothetical protein
VAVVSLICAKNHKQAVTRITDNHSEQVKNPELEGAFGLTEEEMVLKPEDRLGAQPNVPCQRAREYRGTDNPSGEGSP